MMYLYDVTGKLKKLTTLKVDDNQLTSLPNTIGRLVTHLQLIQLCKRKMTKAENTFETS